MKSINKIIPTLITLPVVLASTISCSPIESEAEKIAKAIFNPAKLDPVETDKTFINNLKSLSSDELNSELIYDLFDFANTDTTYVGKTISQLYEDGTVAIKTNISKCNLRFDNEKLLADFLGYVSFVFIKQYKENLKANKLTIYLLLFFYFLVNSSIL